LKRSWGSKGKNSKRRSQNRIDRKYAGHKYYVKSETVAFGFGRPSELALLVSSVPEEVPRVVRVTCISQSQGRYALRPRFSICIQLANQETTY
jgi:hypothetical protein